MREGTRPRLIRISIELLDSLGTRTDDGRKLSAEWGEPVDTAIHGELIYEPTFTATDDGKVITEKGKQ